MENSRFKIANDVFKAEAKAILQLEKSLDKNFSKAIDLLLASKGKVIVSGMGKSGIIGKKMAATLSSTGTPALFLHPAEASHGDLGVIEKKDVVVAISYGGSSSELDALFAYLKRQGIPLIGITGNAQSHLAKNSDCVIAIPVSKEACPLNLAPTSSTTATLAMCDALAMVLLDERGFKERDFAEYHPGGSLGRRLLTHVKDLLTPTRFPFVREEDTMESVIEVMTTREVKGVCGVLNKNNELVGAITDGDVRRWFQKAFKEGGRRDEAGSKDLMSTNPKCISEDELAQKALYIMEQFSITSLFVMREGEKKPVGVLHIQDLLDAKIK